MRAKACSTCTARACAGSATELPAAAGGIPGRPSTTTASAAQAPAATSHGVTGASTCPRTPWPRRRKRATRVIECAFTGSRRDSRREPCNRHGSSIGTIVCREKDRTTSRWAHASLGTGPTPTLAGASRLATPRRHRRRASARGEVRLGKVDPLLLTEPERAEQKRDIGDADHRGGEDRPPCCGVA